MKTINRKDLKMRMIDLNLNIIKKAHADDIQAYKHTKASPQHLHRHWLLLRIEEMKLYLNHEATCEGPFKRSIPCSCGLDKLLEKLE